MATIAALKEVRKAIASEKPNTAVSDWVDRLCTSRYQEDEYDGIPELMESINLQTTGPTEAARAIRKKLKYSNVHGQLRAWTILNALVENGGRQFQTTFANEKLVERIKIMAGDPMSDTRVKKKLMVMLLNWNRQFHGDPSMATVANLYSSCGGGRSTRNTRSGADEAFAAQQKRYEEEVARQREAKANAKKEKEQAKVDKARKRDMAKSNINNRARGPFDLNKEKHQLMESVANASMCSQNLVNSLQLVNRETTSVVDDPTVQDRLAKAKAARKNVVRYIQLLENDPDGEYLGMLINTNEQIVRALELYDRLGKTTAHYDSDSPHEFDNDDHDDDVGGISRDMDKVSIAESEIEKLQDRQRTRVNRYNSRAETSGSGPSSVQTELQDIYFGSSGQAGKQLATPIKPKHSAHEQDDEDFGATLSDYSDFDDSSDGEIRSGPPPTSADAARQHGRPEHNDHHRGPYQNLVDSNRDDEEEEPAKSKLIDDADDPFADPDDASVGTPGITEKRRMSWKEV